eukprot:10696193-Heterocapsa_arctica.AAC.1
MLGHPDPAIAMLCLARVKEDWRVFNEIQKRPSNFWQARCRRSCMALPLAQETMMLASRFGFTMKPALQAVARACFA